MMTVVCLQIGKLVYCTRTVPEMEKVLAELQVGCGSQWASAVYMRHRLASGVWAVHHV